MNPFSLTADMIATLFRHHDLNPICGGDWLGWEEDQADDEQPHAASILGVLMIDNLGWKKSLEVFFVTTEELPPDLRPDRMDEAPYHHAIDTLGVSSAFVSWLIVGWDWELKGTKREFEVPSQCTGFISQYAYRLGVETRMKVELHTPIVKCESAK